MRPSPSRVGWAISTSVLTHVALLLSPPRPPPREPAVVPKAVEFAVVNLPSADANGEAGRDNTPSAPPEPNASGPVRVDESHESTGAVDEPPRRKAPPRPTSTGPRAPKPKSSATVGLPRKPNDSDLAAGSGVLERTLRKIAATTQLTLQQRRRAMLVVLRTWEDPSRTIEATLWVDSLLLEQP
jgi:hypothetical protein